MEARSWDLHGLKTLTHRPNATAQAILRHIGTDPECSVKVL